MARAGESERGPLRAARTALAGFTLLALAVVALEVAQGDVTTTLEPRSRRPAAVVTDGERILEIEARTGRVAATLLSLPADADERITAVAPRPDAFQGLPLLVLGEDDRGALLWWVDEAARRRELPEELARPDVGGGLRSVEPVPVWSPDGSHFAWLEGTREEPVLRVAAWSADGPRADDPRHNRSSLGRGLGTAARLESWRWDSRRPVTTGSLLVSDDQPGLSQVDVRRDAGEVRALNGRPRRLPGAVVDRADAGRRGEGPWPRYQLVLPMETDRSPQLRWTAADGASGVLPLPSGIGGSRTRWWLDAFGGLILIGDGQRAWALEPDGHAVEIPGRVVHGGVLERAARDIRSAPIPTPGGRRME